jgi:lysozyme family protein
MPDCPNLPAGLDLQFFDTAVNMGSNRAVKLLQASLGLAADGDWGPLTQAAVVAITPATLPGIIKDETGLRLKTYQSFGGYREFGADWSRRDAEIGAEALKMVSI